jgi:DNA-binding response OmpR family regulator
MKKKILVIDDDPDILEPLKLILEDEGYNVQTTYKGSETIQKAKTFKPNVILLDILMSGSDGRVICKNLKQNHATKNIPVIMMSAHPTAKFDSENSGANDFIAKPFDTEELLKILHKNLQDT